ncbi:MAG: single-stranded DNA-binding protein [Candidatus Peregrinibacteria bacterium]
MRSVNKVIIIGNLTRDPEMRQTPNGQNVTTFGLATNREWITKDNERKSSAEFHECVAWARLAEICTNYLKKGNLIYVEGYLKTRSWDNQDGVKKFKTEIVVQDMIILEKKKKLEEEYVPQEDEETENREEKETMKEKEEEPEPAEEEPEQSEEKSETNPIDKDLGL